MRPTCDLYHRISVSEASEPCALPVPRVRSGTMWDVEPEDAGCDGRDPCEALMRSNQATAGLPITMCQPFDSLPNQSLQGLSQGNRCFSHSATSW